MFLAFLNSRHPSLIEEQFGGTPSSNLFVNISQFQKLAPPLELYMAPKGKHTGWEQLA